MLSVAENLDLSPIRRHLPVAVPAVPGSL